MLSFRRFAGLLAALMLIATAGVKAADTQAELEKLKKEVDDLRRKLNAPAPAMRSSVEKAIDSKYGPNAAVTTRSGRLTIGGLVQVWYYSIDNDNQGLFNDPAGNGTLDTNEGQDNDSFRIRRTEIKFTMDIHENVTAVVMIDPAREATSFPNVIDNQGRNANGVFKSANQVAPEFDGANGPGLGSTASISGVQLGSGGVPRLLQDAYINYHGVIPHHDFTVGQFKPFWGEEGIRSSAQLDFVERSFVGLLGDQRDLGLTVHGTWWDDRFQYWLGIFDGAGNYFGTAGQAQNRSDDNDEKDWAGRFLVRPLWKNECWGSIELGASTMMGKHGEASGSDPINAPINGLNRNQNWAMRHAAWMSYMPGGPVRGLWFRGEWAWVKDRNAPGSVVDLTGAGGTDIGNTGSGSGLAQSNGKPFSSQGWYVALGYKLSDSCWSDCSYSWLKSLEFAARYQQFQNVQTADLNNPAHTDDFTTRVWTGGINYYIKGHDAKIQANYNVVDDPKSNSHGFHQPDNNSFVVNFQVAF